MISPSELISAPSRLLFRSFGVAVFGIVLADLPPRTVAHRRSGNGLGLFRCLRRPIRSLRGLRRLTLLCGDVLVVIPAHRLDALCHLGQADAWHEGVTESCLRYFGLKCLFTVCQ